MHQFCWPLVTAELKNGSAHLSLCSAESDTQAAIHYTLDHRYNANRYNTDSVTARLKSWIPIFWDWPKLDIDSTVSVNRTHAIPMPTKWAGVFSASPLHPAIDLILMYTRKHTKHGKPYTVLKSDTPNWEDTRRDAHMRLNSPAVISINYDDPPATASQTKTLLHQSLLTAQQSQYRLLQRLFNIYSRQFCGFKLC